MGRHKCEVIACLSSQTQCELIVILCTEFMANKFDLNSKLRLVFTARSFVVSKHNDGTE